MAEDVQGKKEMQAEADAVAQPFPEAMDIHDSSEAIFGLMDESDSGEGAFDVVDGDEGEPSDDSGEITDDDESGDDESSEADDDEDFDEDEDFDDEGDEADADDEDEVDDETTDSDEPQTHTVKVDGEEIEVTLDEALAGYQRQQAFTRKTQELAAERNALAEENQVVRDAQAEYGQYLNVAERLIEQLAGARPDPALKTTDATAYNEQLAVWQAGQERLEVITQERDRLSTEAAETAKTERATKVREEKEKLPLMIPTWIDEDVAAEELQGIAKFVKEQYGVTDAQLSTVVEAQWIDLMRRAMLFTQLEAGGEEITDKKRKRKGKKAAQLAAGGKPNTGKRKRKKGASKSGETARKRLNKSGSIDDAAEAIFDFID